MSVLILKEFRDKYGIDRDAQAELLKISIDTLNNWEYRKGKIPDSKIRNVEYVFNMYKDNISTNKSGVPYYNIRNNINNSCSYFRGFIFRISKSTEIQGL